MNIITDHLLVGGGKGGVGKSFVTACVAKSFEKLGVEVGIVDLDIWGPSQNIIFEGEKLRFKNGKIIPHIDGGIRVAGIGSIIESETGLVWTKQTISNIIQTLIYKVDWGNSRLLLIDCPPGFNEVHVELSRIFITFNTLLVCISTPHAISDCKRTINLLKQRQGKIIGILENFSDMCCVSCNHSNTLFKGNLVEKLANDENINLFDRIPFDNNGKHYEIPSLTAENILQALNINF
jgi:ATP-binding protein involved in chromosome partitioning